MQNKDIISLGYNATLSDLFYERVKRSSDKTAYSYFDTSKNNWIDLSWNDMEKQVKRWHAAFRHEGLVKGDRVAIMMKNSPDWVIFDQAAYTLGLVVVPVYTNDRVDNISYIVSDSGVKVFFVENTENCKSMLEQEDDLDSLIRIVSATPVKSDSDLISYKDDWLPSYSETIERENVDENSLATIVYTSGTTGKPKGVMLSHKNMLSNAYAGATFEEFYTSDVFLSFLPLSHMFERTAGYYLPMVAGATIVYARSIEDLAEDLINIKPTVFVTVPRIFERVYNKIYAQLENKSPVAQKLFKLAVDVGWNKFLLAQRRGSWSPGHLIWPVLNKLVAGKIIAKLGGRMRLAVSGGAALAPEIARTFIGLGLTISQGYGLTEASPIISTNKLDNNDPFSVGQTLPGIEVKLGENDELLSRGDNVMLGYWNNEAASKQVIDDDGWLHTGDKAAIKDGHIYITGRLKEIIVMSNGEKVPPSDIELAITSHKYFEQAMLIGEAKPYLSVVVVVDETMLGVIAKACNVTVDPSLLSNETVKDYLRKEINGQLSDFPGYAKIIKLHASTKPWSIEDGLITPTLKLKRNRIYEFFNTEIESMYAGH